MTPTPEIKKTTQRLRCHLTDEERLNAGKELAEATNYLIELEEDRSRIVSDFKAKTTAQQAEISVLSNKLRTGYEFRDVKCEIHFDKPDPGQKLTLRIDTGATVSIETMSEEEKQRSLALEEAPT